MGLLYIFILSSMCFKLISLLSGVYFSVHAAYSIFMHVCDIWSLTHYYWNCSSKANSSLANQEINVIENNRFVPRPYPPCILPANTFPSMPRFQSSQFPLGTQTKPLYPLLLPYMWITIHSHRDKTDSHELHCLKLKK
jgi:hypothetical protein